MRQGGGIWPLNPSLNMLLYLETKSRPLVHTKAWLLYFNVVPGATFRSKACGRQKLPKQKKTDSEHRWEAYIKSHIATPNRLIPTYPCASE